MANKCQLCGLKKPPSEMASQKKCTKCINRALRDARLGSEQKHPELQKLAESCWRIA